MRRSDWAIVILVVLFLLYLIAHIIVGVTTGRFPPQ